jgi:hypothetical protein
MTFSTGKENVLKFIQKQKRLKIPKAILSKKSDAEGYHNTCFELYYRAMVTHAA